MKFSKNSWHYNFNYFMCNSSRQIENTKSLCQYFWFTVWNVLKFLGASVAVLALAVVCLFLTHCAIAFFLGAFGIFYAGDSWVGGATMMLIVCVVALIMGFIEFIHGGIKFWPHYISKHFTKVSEVVQEKSPSLVVEYVKATKSKICPVIEWEYDDE